MKKMYTITVDINDTDKIEKALNMFKIGLNDWDKTRVMILNGQRVVNYVVICAEDVFNSIVNIMYSR